MSRLRKELYRLPREGKIAGVCAGIAEYFGFEVWLVRIVAISGLLLSGSLFFVLYIAGWFILDVKPGSEKPPKDGNKKRHWQAQYSSDGSRNNDGNNGGNNGGSQFHSRFASGPIEVKEKVWQAGEPPKQAFHDIVSQYQGLEKRLQNLETYVTSTEFTVAREINRL